MKICVLGGCGAMARAVLKPLADEKSVKKVVIADLDGKKDIAQNHVSEALSYRPPELI